MKSQWILFVFPSQPKILNEWDGSVFLIFTAPTNDGARGSFNTTTTAAARTKLHPSLKFNPILPDLTLEPASESHFG
jgi:hypothetical protein